MEDKKEKKKEKTASKIVKIHKEKFNKNHEDKINLEKALERIKNEIEDGENFGSI